jgi:hypothetical protein
MPPPGIVRMNASSIGPAENMDSQPNVRSFLRPWLSDISPEKNESYAIVRR